MEKDRKPGQKTKTSVAKQATSARMAATKPTTKRTPPKKNITKKPTTVVDIGKKNQTEEMLGLWRTDIDTKNDGDKFSSHFFNQNKQQTSDNSAHNTVGNLASPSHSVKQTEMIEAYLQGIQKHSEQPPTPVLSPQKSIQDMESNNAESARIQAAKIERVKVETTTIDSGENVVAKANIEKEADKVKADKAKADKAKAYKAKAEIIPEQVTGASMENNQDENEIESDDPYFEKARDAVDSIKQDSALSRQYEESDEKCKNNTTEETSRVVEEVSVTSIGSSIIKVVGTGATHVASFGKYAVLGVKYGINDSIGLGKSSVSFVQDKIKRQPNNQTESEEVNHRDEIVLESLGSGIANVLGSSVKLVANAGKYSVAGVKYCVSDGVKVGKNTATYLGSFIKKNKTETETE